MGVSSKEWTLTRVVVSGLGVWCHGNDTRGGALGQDGRRALDVGCLLAGAVLTKVWEGPGTGGLAESSSKDL